MLIYMIFYVNLMLINESLMGEDKIKCYFTIIMNHIINYFVTFQGGGGDTRIQQI